MSLVKRNILSGCFANLNSLMLTSSKTPENLLVSVTEKICFHNTLCKGSSQQQKTLADNCIRTLQGPETSKEYDEDSIRVLHT